MGIFHHAQPSFAAGELSKRLRGRVDAAEVYGRGLAHCENWMVLPQGPLLLRAGTWLQAAQPALPRLFPFRISGRTEDHVLAIRPGAPGKLRVYSRAGGLETIVQNLVENGHFDGDLSDWTVTNNVTAEGLKAKFGLDPFNTPKIEQVVPTAPGAAYTLKFRVKRGYYTPGFEAQTFQVAIDGVAIAGSPFLAPAAETEYTHAFVAAGASITLRFTATSFVTIPPDPPPDFAWLDDVRVYRDGVEVTELDAPWDADQLAALHFSAEPVNNLAVFTCQGVRPHVVQFSAPNGWSLYPAVYANQPADWGDGNWPATVELGFQGRAWYGASPSNRNTIWASKTGNPFDFGVSTPLVASDAMSWLPSTKGAVQWLQGQKSLLLGSEVTEMSATGAGGLIAPGNIDVHDESAFGSAPVQALHVGDQVVFATRDRRRLHALAYSNEANGWVARELTFLARHLLDGRVRAIHFARAPDPFLLVEQEDGELRAFTYDRAEQVIAGWRISVGSSVASAAVVDTEDGSELWLAVTRGGAAYIERLPLHEEGVTYVDSAIAAVVAGGVVAGLEHLEGQAVQVVVNGAVGSSGVVAGGELAVQEADGTAVVVGLPFRALARTLPTEGGNPRGTAQLSKRRRVSVVVRLNDSALPLVGGERPADRDSEEVMDAPPPRTTGDVQYGPVDADDGVVEIEQDLPIRTEVLALFSAIQVQDVH